MISGGSSNFLQTRGKKSINKKGYNIKLNIVFKDCNLTAYSIGSNKEVQAKTFTTAYLPSHLKSTGMELGVGMFGDLHINSKGEIQPAQQRLQEIIEEIKLMD